MVAAAAFPVGIVSEIGDKIRLTAGAAGGVGDHILQPCGLLLIFPPEGGKIQMQGFFGIQQLQRAAPEGERILYTLPLKSVQDPFQLFRGKGDD